MTELLKQLCAASGISGDEARIRGILLNEIKGYADCSVDRMGNLIAVKKGAQRPAVRLMLCAHMDEVGLMVTSATDEGFLRFSTVGGIDPRVLIGRRVKLTRSGRTGLIGTKAVHLQNSDERKSSPTADKLLIDIGAFSKEEALAAVAPGDAAVFDSEWVDFGDGLVKARALDDRVGCAILAELIKQELPYDCTFVFSVQEEVGLRGAKAAAYSVAPEAAIVVEATTAADIANVEEGKKVCRVGGGPVLGFMDNRTVYDRELFALAKELAAEKGIKFQVKQAVAGGNDSGSIHVAAGGVKTIAVSLPCRYLHSPSCVIRYEDAQETLRLVKELSAAIAGGAYAPARG